MADHPRIRGEHLAEGGDVGRSQGSSPHTRGAPRPGRGSFRGAGIIPAYAGSTSRGRGRGPGGRDHPRIRGEHSRPGPSGPGRPGSSPHTRGARHRSGYHGCRPGIIPAYAGSTVGGACGRSSGRDHPRIRGEHGDPDRGPPRGWGSSPHTRGARGWLLASRSRPGIIPAYAGSTTPTDWRSNARADHPRIRGEHPTRFLAASSLRGSSPHTRGARHVLGRARVRLRIIPAYAGSTRRPSWGMRAVADHPRIRGEHDLRPCFIGQTAGSSPHTRGALGIEAREQSFPGIIPAYAGSTCPRHGRRPARRDHPRIRGEHSSRSAIP